MSDAAGDCLTEVRPVPGSDGMWMYRCRVHDVRWSIRRYDDPPFRCIECDPTMPEEIA